MPQLVLASASPRRRALLLQAGFTFDIQATETDETSLPDEDAVALAIRLARTKAEAIAQIMTHHVILGADTVVLAPTGELLGKPQNAEDATRMLRLLSGKTHQVVTGVCVHAPERVEVAAALTYVTFFTVSEAEIASYIAGGEPMGKAGSYAIQGSAARWIPHIQGDYSNVVGLPLALITTMLAAMGVTPNNVSVSLER